MKSVVLLAALALAGCRTEGLPGENGSVSACARAGGRCVPRPTSGINLGEPQCAADEYALSPLPLLCNEEVEDCCITRCPAQAPELGGACRSGTSCQYPQVCEQFTCIDEQWYVAVEPCPAGG